MRQKQVLVVLDAAVGMATAQVRGLRFVDKFAQEGWDAEFVDVSNASADDIVARARRMPVVYLIKVHSLELLLRIKRETSAKIVFDLTDALWLGDYRSAWSDIEKIIIESDAIFTENGYVGDFALTLSDHVAFIPVCTLVEQFQELRSREPHLLSRDSTVTIGWVGSPITVTALERIRPQLEACSAKHPNVRLRFAGVGNASFAHWRANVSTLPRYDETQMLREILQMDIGIYPPPAGLKEYIIRGPQKAMLYMTGGAVPVCKNAGDCARRVVHGVNGMLASTDDDWLTAFETLVVDTKMRRRMSEIGQCDMVPNSLDMVFKKLEASLLDVQDIPRTRPSRFRVMRALTGKGARDFEYRMQSLMKRVSKRLQRARARA